MGNNEDARRFTGTFRVHLTMAAITVKFCCNTDLFGVYVQQGYNFPMLCLPYVQELMKMYFKVAVFIF